MEQFLYRKINLTIEEIQNYVLNNVHLYDVIQAPRDYYNYSVKKASDKADKTVIGFYPHIILTIDTLGRTESYTYYDLYKLLKTGTLSDE